MDAMDSESVPTCVDEGGLIMHRPWKSQVSNTHQERSRAHVDMSHRARSDALALAHGRPRTGCGCVAYACAWRLGAGRHVQS
eukprot:7694-Prymnesium_polylepis.1